MSLDPPAENGITTETGCAGYPSGRDCHSQQAAASPGAVLNRPDGIPPIETIRAGCIVCRMISNDHCSRRLIGLCQAGVRSHGVSVFWETSFATRGAAIRLAAWRMQYEKVVERESQQWPLCISYHQHLLKKPSLEKGPTRPRDRRPDAKLGRANGCLGRSAR